MGHTYKILGNKNSLFSMHGTLNVDKAVDALACMAILDEVDIDAINKKSESGCIYITSNGKMLDYCGKSSEQTAKYKIVPTGLKLRYTDYPLFASFMKSKQMWEGAYIGTGVQLFEMYKNHYKSDERPFCDEYIDVFGGENRVRDIKGFGLREVVSYEIDTESLVFSDVEITDEADTVSALSKALEEAMKEVDREAETSNKKGSKQRHLTKAQRKAQRLKAHLDKAIEREGRQLKTEDDADTDSNTDSVNLEEPLWSDVQAIEDVHEDFVDDVTKSFNEKIEDFLNSDESYTKLSDVISNIEAHTEEVQPTSVIDTEPEQETVESLLVQMDLDYNSSVVTDKEKFRMQLKYDLINDVYERLLIKENWKNSSRNRLGFYLKGICLYVYQYRHNNYNIHTNGNKFGNGYLMNEANDKCVINTGLLDIYGNYLYLIDHTPEIPGFYSKVMTVMLNKASLLNMGFNLMDIKKLPEPIKFGEQYEMLFNCDYDDFDFDDTAHLNHIIAERLERFPKKYREESSLVLCERIRSSIQQAIKISKSDYRYVLPIYDFCRSKIQHLIPLYLDNNIDEKPELVIVVGKDNNDIWTMFTVLDSESAYDDARLVCKPSDTWLNIHK